MSDKKTTIIAARHGETLWNVQGRWQGHFNSPLTAKGKAQAEALAKRLKTIDFTHLYSSDLGRAVATAEPIAAAKGLEIKRDKRLRERSLGIFEGMTREEMILRYPDEYRLYLKREPEYPLPEGESVKEKYRRHTEVLAEMGQIHNGETIVIVTHGGVLDSIMRFIINIPLDVPRRFSLINASLAVFTCSKGEWKIETWGDVSHLDPENNFEHS